MENKEEVDLKNEILRGKKCDRMLGYISLTSLATTAIFANIRGANTQLVALILILGIILLYNHFHLSRSITATMDMDVERLGDGTVLEKTPARYDGYRVLKVKYNHQDVAVLVSAKIHKHITPGGRVALYQLNSKIYGKAVSKPN